MTKLSVIDLFAGIGGFSLGLHRTGGYETVKFCEMKPHAQRVLAKNFPGIPCHDDVTTYDFKPGEADVITAGFPCQDISFAGDGAGLAGARSGLYREVIRALRVVRPQYAILENVAALLSRGLDVVLGDMAEIGYDAEWHCIPASAVGAPHRRDRIWIIADTGGEQHESGRAPFSGSLAEELSSPFLAYSYGWDAECRSGKRPGICESEAGEGADDYTSGRSALVADAQGERCNETRELRHREPSEWSAGSGESMGHAGTGWWAVEPDVGRVAHGVPQKLDGALNAQELNAETRSEAGAVADALPGMRADRGPSAASSGLFEAEGSRDPLCALSRESGHGGGLSSCEAAQAVQGVRRGLHADAQQEAQHVQPGVSDCDRTAERTETLGWWAIEPDIPRVAVGVKQRVDRLAELGNAVVSQIPEIIGHAILQARAA